MPRTGRPTKLTPELQAEIVRLIVRGNYIETAAAATGIDKTTFYDWLRTGRRLREKQDKGEKITAKKELALIDFSHAIEKAIGDSEDRDVAVIDRAAQNGQWQAAAWRLERKQHKKWGRKLALTDADGGSIAENAAMAWAKALQVPETGDDSE